MQFAAALELVAQRARGAPLCALQTGAHPVLEGAVAALGAAAGVQLVAQAASLRRKVPALAFIRQQRAQLGAAGVLEPALRAALSRAGALQLEAGSRTVAIELGLTTLTLTLTLTPQPSRLDVALVEPARARPILLADAVVAVPAQG